MHTGFNQCSKKNGSMKNNYRNFWLNKRHEFVCGLNNLSFATYHDMFAGEYQVGYGRFHSVEKLHASSYIDGESQCLILIHYYTYKYIVATGYLQFTSTGVNWAWFNFLSFVDSYLLYLTFTWFQFNTSFLNDKKKEDTFYLFLHVRH